MMKEAMVQIQLVIPSLKADASVTATLKKDPGLIMAIESAINIPETSSLQKVTIKYGSCQTHPSLLLHHRNRIKDFFIFHSFFHVLKNFLFTDDDKFEAELNSDLNSEIQRLIPNAENYHRQLQQLIDDILDQKVAKTDMKLRHIVTKAIEVQLC